MRLLPRRSGPKCVEGDVGLAPYIWLVFLAFFYFKPILDPNPGRREWLLTIAATIVFLVLYFATFWVRRPWNYLLIAAIVAMGLGLGHHNEGAAVFIIYGAMFLAWTFDKAWHSLVAIAVLVLLLALDRAFLHAPLGFWGTATIVSLGVGVSNTLFAERKRALDKLRVANEEIEHLAKVAERERIARDLHDVLGHTLSLIIVKSTLAGKLLDKDPQSAKGEIRDIEKVSRQAMAEIRSTLRGYSAYKLHDELQRARSTLASAGVSVESDAAEVSLSPAQESVVALIMREAVTNVVRHAQARFCRLLLGTKNGSCVLEIQDDGRGGNQIEGHGLRGMRERIEALGGTVTRDTSSGTRLRFEFPVSTPSNGAS